MTILKNKTFRWPADPMVHMGQKVGRVFGGHGSAQSVSNEYGHGDGTRHGDGHGGGRGDSNGGYCSYVYLHGDGQGYGWGNLAGGSGAGNGHAETYGLPFTKVT